MSISNNHVKRSILLVWFLWSAVVSLSNIFDVFRSIPIIPDSFKFVSGNLGYISSATSIYNIPQWINWVLFLCVIWWETTMSVFFLKAFKRIKYKTAEIANPAFIMGIILFGGFLVMDELLIAYDRLGSIEENHFIIFIGMIVSLLAVHLLPSED